jgi:hypothetical protein
MHAFEDAGRFTLSPVSWHELARHGVTVVGRAVETLGVWTDDDVLRSYTVGNLDTYWRRQAEACTASPANAAAPFVCEWVVPGVARLHHLLVTGEQTAKSRAVRWGLGFHPERFHRVLRESLAIREGAFEPQYDDAVERGRDVAAFATYVVRQGVASTCEGVDHAHAAELGAGSEVLGPELEPAGLGGRLQRNPSGSWSLRHGRRATSSTSGT